MNPMFAPSGEAEPGFFRTIYQNTQEAFNSMREMPSAALGYFAVLGAGVGAGGAYEVYEGAKGGIEGAPLVGLGVASLALSIKYVRTAGAELLRRYIEARNDSAPAEDTNTPE